MKIIKDIAHKLNRFLWNGKDNAAARAKVALVDLCFPKKRGRVLKDLKVWNKASMMRHIWSLFARSNSI